MLSSPPVLDLGSLRVLYMGEHDSSSEVLEAEWVSFVDSVECWVISD